MPLTERATFYDQHPFDWAVTGAKASIRSVVSPLLVELIESIPQDSVVLDVGCGPGRVLWFLAERKLHCFGLDRSRVSVGLAAERCRRPCAVADNLELPISTASVDVVISDGVIHHTEDPRAALAENLRILKPGGKMYLGVYKPGGRYPLLYRFPGAWIRGGVAHWWSEPLVVAFAEFPYFLVHFVRSRGQRNWQGARNLFFDYFVTPRVAFLSRAQVEEWSQGEGAIVLRYDENRRTNVHSFLIQKAAFSPTSRTEPQAANKLGPLKIFRGVS
jgi:SAM-dependent methyltransferase